MDLISENEDIKIVFIELPVLGQSSLLASKAAYEALMKESTSQCIKVN